MANDQSPSTTSRVWAIDVLRGAVMLLMAIDHVRVYSGLPAGGPTPGIFFTRWVTHFCAPVFVFLAGSSAYFYGRRHPNLSRFLVTRGAWLVLLELTLLRVAWTFNFDFMRYNMAGVLWAIGWCMILLALLVRLPLRVVAAIGVVIIAGHDLIDPHLGAIVKSLGSGPASALWKILYLGFFGGPIRFGPDGPNLIVLYSLVPWIGVMAAGYAFGAVFAMEPARRNRICLALGLSAVVLFLVLRGFDLYGDPRPWRAGVTSPNGGPAMPAVLAFLNTNKYPASLLFLLMTLGPALALVPVLDRATGTVARWITVYGRVPFFYYVLHIPLIHSLALIVSVVRFGSVSPWLFADHPMGAPPPPDGYPWGLPLLYLVWATVILALYVPCRWLVGVKARRKDAWLSYL